MTGELSTLTGNLENYPPFEHQLVRTLLSDRHIPLTKEALLQALHNEDPKIRYLAAWELADEGIKEAIPDVAAALEAEKEPQARVVLACALVELGDKRGVEALRRDCDDATLPTDIRLEVAIDLLALRVPSCPKVVGEGFAARDDGVITAMSHFQKFSPSQYAELRRLLLKNKDPWVRWRAAEAMDNLGDVGAIPDIEAALATESDDLARKVMGDALERLRSLRSEPSSNSK